MIIALTNPKQEKLKEAHRNINILKKELKLPANYQVDYESFFGDFIIRIYKKGLFLGILPDSREIARVLVNPDTTKLSKYSIYTIEFKEEEDYLNIQNYFEESVILFKIVIGEGEEYY